MGVAEYAHSFLTTTFDIGAGVGMAADKFVKKRACSCAENGTEYVSGKMGPITSGQSGSKAARWIHGGATERTGKHGFKPDGAANGQAGGLTCGAVVCGNGHDYEH